MQPSQAMELSSLAMMVAVQVLESSFQLAVVH